MLQISAQTIECPRATTTTPEHSNAQLACVLDDANVFQPAFTVVPSFLTPMGVEEDLWLCILFYLGLFHKKNVYNIIRYPYKAHEQIYHSLKFIQIGQFVNFIWQTFKNRFDSRFSFREISHAKLKLSQWRSCMQ